MPDPRVIPSPAANGESGPGPAASPPRVWVIGGYRAGERTQTTALARALGWPFEIKDLAHNRRDTLPGLLRMRSLAGLRPESRARLGPPWPDLVISAGMRNEPVCRWIRERSGGRTRLVHIGRPWAAIEHFDLVITTPQYRLPDRPNVLHNTGTLHDITPGRLAQAADAWRERFARLPAPYIGVILGGDSGPYTFGPRAARVLAAAASRMAAARGGSLLVTTSARTSAAAVEALHSAISRPAYVYHWRPEAAANPYLGILALAEELLVTSDSVSMASEAVATGKPVHLFDLDARAAGRREDFRLGALGYRWLMGHSHPRLTRDLGLFHRGIMAAGPCAWLGEPPPRGRGAPPDMARAVARVRALFTSAASPGAGGSV